MLRDRARRPGTNLRGEELLPLRVLREPTPAARRRGAMLWYDRQRPGDAPDAARCKVLRTSQCGEDRPCPTLSGVAVASSDNPSWAPSARFRACGWEIS